MMSVAFIKSFLSPLICAILLAHSCSSDAVLCISIRLTYKTFPHSLINRLPALLVGGTNGKNRGTKVFLLSASGSILGRRCTSLALCFCLDRLSMVLLSSLVDPASELQEPHSLPLFLGLEV